MDMHLFLYQLLIIYWKVFGQLIIYIDQGDSMMFIKQEVYHYCL
jgi:hypothetical protein